jgi:hypothetical protein
MKWLLYSQITEENKIYILLTVHTHYTAQPDSKTVGEQRTLLDGRRAAPLIKALVLGYSFEE